MSKGGRRSRKSLGRSGRLPYSFVGVVILAAMVLLTAYFEFAVNWTNHQGSYNVPEQVTAGIALAEAAVQRAVRTDMVRSEASLLLTGVNPPLEQLNSSLNYLFDISLLDLNLTTPQGYTIGTVHVWAQNWSINLTWSEGQVYDLVPQVAVHSGMNDPNLPLASVPDATDMSRLGLTQLPVYPLAVGSVFLFAKDFGTGQSASTTDPFTVSIQSDLGLLTTTTQTFADNADGMQGGFERLVQYLATTLGELRALSGNGSGGWPGPQSSSNIATQGCTFNQPPNPAPNDPSILACNDIHDAVNLALLLESLQVFRDYDANATYAFLTSLPPGAYQTLLQTYVNDGTVDGAALLLLLLDRNGGWSDNWVATGESMSSAVSSFVDRFKFDILQQFLGQQVVDPTLTEPVTSWSVVDSQSQSYYTDRMYQYLDAYQKWLGIAQVALPHYGAIGWIPAETGSAGGCTYTILPRSNIYVENNGVPNLAELILGSNSPPDTNEVHPPVLFNVFENVTIDPSNYGGGYWTENVSNNPEQAGYYLVDRSLLWEYDPSGNLGGLNLYRNAFTIILNELSQSMGLMGSSPFDNYTGLIHYLANASLADGNNFNWTQAGLPDLNSAAATALLLNDSSYSLLTNGSNALFSGPFALALQKFSTQATNWSWVNSSFVHGAIHMNLLGADNPWQSPTNNWTLADVARLSSRLWFQLMYMLYYGSAGVIPAAPIGPVSYNGMDSANYRITSPGVEHNPPYPFHEPDFAINVMNETYISAVNWMGYGGGGGECGGYFGNCGFTAYNNPNFASGFCTTGTLGTENAAWNIAMDYWYREEFPGGAWHTWLNIRQAVWNALNGTSTGWGVDHIHTLLGQSWWNTKNNTGDAYWQCGLNASYACPSYDSGNFTAWMLREIAPPILNDTVAMGAPGWGWLSQLYASTDRAIWQGANQSSLIDKPWLMSPRPYTFWSGNYSSAQADQQLFDESLANPGGLLMRGGSGALGGLAFGWSQPSAVVHLVDAQNDSSNMGIAPFESTWSVTINGAITVNLTSTRPVLAEEGGLVPTNANYSVPMDLSVPITIYTPWPLSSGWNARSSPLPGDPPTVLTRGVLGLVGRDLHASPNFFNGTYVSAPLDAFLSQAVSVGKVLSSEGRYQAALLAALPDKGVGASTPWAQNLTRLENTTESDLAATAGSAYLASAQANLATLNYLLSRVPNSGGAFTDAPWTQPAFFGYVGQINTVGDQFNYYGYPGTPTWGNPFQYNLSFGGSQVGATYFADGVFRGASPTAPPVSGFCGSWSPTAASQSLYCGATAPNSPGAYTLNAYWKDFSVPYRLTLNGGTAFAPTAPSTVSSAYPSLSVPYLGPGYAFPSSLSVEGLGGVPSSAGTAFQNSIAGYLPSPGAFSSYVAQQQFQAGYLYDALSSTSQPGVDQFGYSTALEYSTVAGEARQGNFTVGLQDPAGLFNTASTSTGIGAFLLWYELNGATLSESLGDASTNPTVLASAAPYLLTNAYRNYTLSTGMLGQPSTYAFTSANLACTENDLGGTGGGLANSPTLLIGGGTPGTWAFGGTLTEG